MKKENLTTVGKTLPDGIREEKNIYGLEEGEEQYYHLLGVGYGINLVHCFSMGAKNKENFWERMFAYKVIPNEKPADLLEEATGNGYISVQFFELG